MSTDKLKQLWSGVWEIERIPKAFSAFGPLKESTICLLVFDLFDLKEGPLSTLPVLGYRATTNLLTGSGMKFMISVSWCRCPLVSCPQSYTNFCSATYTSSDIRTAVAHLEMVLNAQGQFPCPTYYAWRLIMVQKFRNGRRFPTPNLSRLCQRIMNRISLVPILKTEVQPVLLSASSYLDQLNSWVSHDTSRHHTHPRSLPGRPIRRLFSYRRR